MGYPKAKDTINKKVKEVKKMAEDIINQGVVGEGYLKLQKTKEYISALAQKLSVDGNPATEETLVVTVEAKLFNGNGV